MSAELGILWPALAAGLLVAATHVPLGMRVLERGIVFIDLAVAQFAALGVVAAGALGLGEQALVVQASALGAALAGALALAWTERALPEVQEAVIGVSFILAANAAILLLAANPHGAEHLKDLLTGQVLWVTPGVVAVAAALSAAILVAWFGLRPGNIRFYLVFAIAVTLSVQLVGVYLVFATLIVPALATRTLARRRLAAAYGLAAAGYGAGLALSLATDLPAGPLIVCVLGILGCAAMAFRGTVRGTPNGNDRTHS